ncbi:2'-5' RNA ligase family protein [Candidatus Aenigmatarchaeota archaeon]
MIWAIPKGDIGKKFSNLISKLAEKYNGPVFEPHISVNNFRVVGEEENVLTKIKELANQTKPFKITLEKTDFFDEIHMCIVVRTKKTPELMAINKNLINLLDEEIRDYIPHMSLLYGILDNKIKEKILNDIGKTFADEIEVSEIHVFKSPQGKIPDIVKYWKKIATFRLNG